MAPTGPRNLYKNVHFMFNDNHKKEEKEKAVSVHFNSPVPSNHNKFKGIVKQFVTNINYKKLQLLIRYGQENETHREFKRRN